MRKTAAKVGEKIRSEGAFLPLSFFLCCLGLLSSSCRRLGADPSACGPLLQMVWAEQSTGSTPTANERVSPSFSSLSQHLPPCPSRALPHPSFPDGSSQPIHLPPPSVLFAGDRHHPHHRTSSSTGPSADTDSPTKKSALSNSKLSTVGLLAGAGAKISHALKIKSKDNLDRRTD
jgi:hypothetical protein